MADPRNHPLFRQFPRDGEAQLSTGERVPTPYHVYDGHGLLIGGTAEREAVAALLQREKLYPLRTQSGKALLAVWVCDFTAASLGPHTELQIAPVVTHRPVAPLEDHPFALLLALSELPAVRLFCHGLWNNTETAVAYNREVLGLPAQHSTADVTRGDGRKRFTFRDRQGQLLCHGVVQEEPRTPLRVGWDLSRLLGLRRSTALARQPLLAATVVNPVSAVIPTNADAPAFIAPETAVVQYFDAENDALAFGPARYRELHFEPLFLEHFTPFRSVYLRSRW